MNVLITGAGGFIGSFLVESISSDSQSYVYALVSPWDKPSFRSKCNKNINEIIINLSKVEELTLLFDRFSIDIVIHCAFITDTSTKSMSAQKIENLNILTSSKLIELSLKSFVKRFVFISSAGIYKNQRKDLLNNEVDSILPRNNYFYHKLAVENTISYHSKIQDSTNFIILRLGTIFGENEKSSSTRPKTSLIHQILFFHKKQNFVRLNDLGIFKDFFYINNINSLIFSILYTKKHDHLIYNVGSNQSFSIKEIFQILFQNKIDCNYSIVDKANADIVVNLSHNRAPLDIDRISDSFSFNPYFTFEESIVKMFTNLNKRTAL